MGGKRATTTSSVSIPPEVLARYNAVNQQAQTAAATPYEAFGKTASDYVAQMNAQQGAGISDINATAGSYQPYMTQATSATQAGMGPASEGIDRYMSPYIKNVADTTGAYMRQQQEQAQSGALGNAISSGAFGGDRAGIAAANLQQQNQMGYGKTMADILNQGYTQALGASQADLARQMQGGSQLAGLGAQSQQLGLQGAQAKIAAGTMQQQTEQAGKDAMINQFMQEKGYPFQVAQFLANIATGTGAAAGSTTTTQTPRNWLGFASGGAVEGGVAGPRSYSQQGIGGVGYVPAADLPVGQLMVADPPEDNSSDKTAEMIQMIASVMGAKRGGVIDQRHGYAPGGTPQGGLIGLPFSTPVTDELRERLRIRPKAEGYDPSFDYRKQQANIDASMAQDRANPSNMGLAGHMYPKALLPGNDIPLPTPRTTPLPVGPEEQWDIPVRSGMKEPGISFRSGQTEPRPVPFRSGPTPFQSSPAMGGPGTFATGLGTMRPMPRPEGLGYQPTMPEGGPSTMPAGLMPEGLAPTTSMRPLARPAGLAGADVAASTMTALGQPVSADLGSPTQTSSLIDQTAPTLEPKPSNWDMADTGLAPTGGYEPVVPVKKQLDFTMYELKTKPEYKGYLENTYATPAQAAVAFEQIYERANGSGNDVAAANATDIYNAAQSGKLDQMPPNVVTAYNHFIQNGMDPIQAAGATGRLMVESYAHLDPNARNTLGGGNGTYGLAQWRGSRMEELADFAGVPLDAITSAPVSTPEGRYYSHGADFNGGLGGGGQGAGDGLASADMTRQRDGLFKNDKPYEDRNFIGKFFHDRDGSLNPNAVMALLGGLAKGAEAQTISPLGGILSGLGGGMETYKQLLKQQADIGLTQATTRETDVRTDVSSFFSAIPGSDGFPLVRVGPGRMVTLTEYLNNPVAFTTGDSVRDAAIQKEAQRISSSAPASTGADVSAAPEGVRWTSASNDAIEKAKAKLAARPGDWVSNDKASREIMDASSQERASALAAKPNSNELAYTVGSAIAENNMGTATGYMSGTILPVVNAALRTIDPNYEISSADDQATILSKLATLNGAAMTPEQERAASVYRDFVNISPDLKMTPEAGATITAGILSQNQDAIDRANYYSAFMARAGSGVSMADVDAAYAQEYGVMRQQEKDSLKRLFEMAADPQVGPTVKNFLAEMNAGTATQEDAQAVLQYILGPNTPPLLVRYFIKGM